MRTCRGRPVLDALCGLFVPAVLEASDQTGRDFCNSMDACSSYSKAYLAPYLIKSTVRRRDGGGTAAAGHDPAVCSLHGDDDVLYYDN